MSGYTCIYTFSDLYLKDIQHLHHRRSLQALRMILQLGVKSSWFSKSSTAADMLPCQTPETCPASVQDLRNYMINSTLPAVGDSVVPELLLKVLEPYRKEGMLFFFLDMVFLKL